MKKNLIIAILIILLVTFYTYTRSVDEDFNNKIDYIHQTLVERDDEISELKDSLVEKSEACRFELEELDMEIKSQKEKIDGYNYLIGRFFGPSDDGTFDVLKRAFKVSAWIYMDGKKVPLPKNGKIYTKAKQVDFEFIVVNPPMIKHPEIDEYLSSFNNLFNYFEMPLADEYEQDGDYLRFAYSDLEVGDKIDFNINYDLSRLLNMTSSKIEVVITDEFDSGADYMPRNIEMKRYRGGYENAGFEERYTYLSDKTCRKDVSDTGASMSFLYEYEDDLRITHKEGEGMEMALYERLYLPRVIKLGETWEDMYTTEMITGVDVEIETPLGTFKAIEVTSAYDEEQGKYDKIVTYYTKELGMVFSSFYGMESEIVKVDFID